MERKSKSEKTGANEKKEAPKNLVIDCIGESVDFDKCPCCTEHTDCLSNINGRCCALKESGGQECVFYKNREQAVAENRATYKKLKEDGRTDLVMKYGSLLSVVGAFDDDIGDAASITAELDSYAEQDYQKQLQEALRDQEAQEQLTGEEN